MLLEDREPTGPPDGGADITLRTQAVRRKIITVAKHRFAQSGFEQVSLQDVAIGADVDCDDFFLHFHDKQSLLTAILDDAWKGLLPRLKTVVSTSITAHSAILGMLSLMTSALHNDDDLARLILLEGRVPKPDGGTLGFSRGYRRFMRICRELVQRGQQDGSFRPNLHPQAAASMLVGAFEGMLRDRMIEAQERSTTAYTGTYMMPAFDALLWSLKN